MSRQSYVITFTFILSLITYGFISWRVSNQETNTIIDNDLTPDFIAEILQSNIYNQQGELSHIVNAQRMEHYTDLYFTHFEFPEYTIYPKKKSAPWKITAKEATLYDNNRVILESRVRLKATDKDSLIQEIHCKYLELDLNTNIISSEQTIMILGKDFTTYGSGLIIDLNTKQMTLTEHVRTIYKKIES